MKPGRATLSLIIIIIFLFIFLLQRWQEPKRKEAFDRTPVSLEFTRHALCRMDCREISEKDIEAIMKKGIINFNKSNRRDTPCPTYALQGFTSDGENIQVIFAQCSDETRVITCYNLKRDFECDCPGDEKKKTKRDH